jgi:gliding motility-associated-like protein
MKLATTGDDLPCNNAFGDISITVTGGGTAPYRYIWNNGVTTSNLDHVHPGTYYVTVEDANNCEIDTSIVITNSKSFDVSAFGGGTVKLGDGVELFATSTGSGLVSYDWTPPKGLSCTECQKTFATPGETTLYTVTGVDTNGCSAYDTVSVFVIDDHTYFAPNVFTPNNDGHNDYFQIYGNLDGIHSINVMIFDRWGEKVFESSETDFKWDGIYKGKPLPPAVYVYVLKLVYLDAKEKTHEGSITLLR